MRNIKILTAVLVFGLTLPSCKKFVDIKKVSSELYLSTANDCQLLLDNYAYMNSNYPMDGEISADDYYVIGDSYKETATLKVPLEERDLHTWLATAKRSKADPNWQAPYFVIYNANLVLETLAKLDPVKEDATLLNTLKGSALFYRAYALWQVAQLYAKPYGTTADQDPGIPIRLTSDMNFKSSRGTVKQTYDQILQDLNQASALLPATSSIATRPNKVAAYAMLARTYLSMEDYPNASINADEALKRKSTLLNYNTISTTSASPFARFNSEVIFHSITYYRANLVGTILLQGSAATNIAKIDPLLVASYATNDLRRLIFLKANAGINAGTFRFTGNYEQSFSPTPIFFNGLAVDEMFLIRAECYARAGKATEASNDLNTLLKMRWRTGFYTNITETNPDEVLKIILAERRKELLMRGLRWSDLRRLNKDPRFQKNLTRTITVNGVTNTYTLPPNDLRYVLLVPDEVITNSNLEQNIR